MKRLTFLLIMAGSLLSCGFLAHKPKGDLTYCRYCRAGAAGLGTDYCELVAEPDSVPKVVVVMDEDNRFGDPVIRRSYPVDQSVVDSLAAILAERKVYRLNGYSVNEPICGGHSYGILVHYSSGDQIDAHWYGHKIKDQAIAAYNTIEYFFGPWRAQAVKDEKAEQTLKRVVSMETIYDRVYQAVQAKQPYPEMREDVDSLMQYMDSGQWKADFEADERGELPKDLKRGVLSEDGLYNLLRSL